MRYLGNFNCFAVLMTGDGFYLKNKNTHELSLTHLDNIFRWRMILNFGFHFLLVKIVHILRILFLLFISNLKTPLSLKI